MEKNKLMLVIIIALLVVLLAGIGFAIIKITSALPKGEGENPDEQMPPQKEIVLKIEEVTTIPLAAPIKTNLKTGTDGTPHQIQIGIAIGVNNTDKKQSPTIIGLITANESVTRDIILSVVTNITYEELMSGDAKSILSETILQRLQEEYQSDLIYKVYINDLVIV